MLTIERTRPEDAGVPSQCIMRMISRLERKKIPMHSLLLMRHGKLICECYYKPCSPHDQHRMFSITKSFTSIAIGLLADEGRISLDDRIVGYFPEKVPKDVHPYIAQMTIRDMLMMRTCHASTTYKLDLASDWVGSFFTTPPTHPPGSVFHYDTSGAHVLCALVEKLTGMDMLDYIKKKLPGLGLSEGSRLLKDPFGVSIGGSGLVATSEDILRFGIFLYSEGNIDGEQLLSADYIRTATSLLTATEVTAPLPSEACGYGMQFWRTEKNGYVCYGMGGQLIIVLPDYDVICVTTADTQGIGGGNQQIYDALYEEVLPYLDREGPAAASDVGGDGGANHDHADDPYARFIASQSLLAPDGAAHSPIESEISGRRYLIDGDNGFSFMELRFNPDGESGGVKFGYGNGEYEIPFGSGPALPGILPLYGLRCASSGVWLPDGTFYVKVNVIDSCVGSIHLQFSFQGRRLVVFMRKQEESVFGEFEGHLVGTLADRSCPY